MQTQWYLCQISECPRREAEELKKTDNLSVKYPDLFIDGLFSLFGDNVIEENRKGNGSWFVWLPIIPRVGDTLQFSGWQVQVSKVLLLTDYSSKSGIQEGTFVSAKISIRDDVVQSLTDAHFSVESTYQTTGINKWETFARRGNDLQYFAWELNHESFIVKSSEKSEELSYYRWHTRIRPFAGDTINVLDKKWKVTSVELSSANDSIDGILHLEKL